MGKYDDIVVAPEQASRVIERGNRLFEDWGLTPPPVEPLVIHFGLDDFENIGETEYWLANEYELGYCGKFLLLFESQRCPCHYHETKHETFYIVKGEIEMTIDDEVHVMSQGDLLVMQTGQRHTFVARGGPALILEVSMPSKRQDNFFDDEQIGESGVI